MARGGDNFGGKTTGIGAVIHVMRAALPPVDMPLGGCVGRNPGRES